MKIIASVTLIILSGLVLSSAFLWKNAHNQAPISLGSQSPIFEISNSSTTIVSTASSLLISTSTGRRALEIWNSGSSVAYCNINDRVAYDKAGFAVYASSSKRFEGDFLYTGAIRCISSSTAPMGYIEAI